MNSVMLSIRPKWCELIASGKKTIEVRRTKPNIQTPFKCYIYETQGTYDDVRRCKTFQFWKSRQKVIGEFACVCVDKIEVITAITTDYVQVNGKRSETITRDACLSIDELQNYGDWKPVYGWHISDLKIYDKPKELKEFVTVDKEAIRRCKHRSQNYYGFTDWGYIKNGFRCDDTDYWCFGCKRKPLTRPPQSWCYVEELK